MSLAIRAWLPLGARASPPAMPRLPTTRANARDTLILAFSRKGLTGVGLRPIFANAATALARVTLTLALSHKGRGDPLVAIRT